VTQARRSAVGDVVGGVRGSVSLVVRRGVVVAEVPEEGVFAAWHVCGNGKFFAADLGDPSEASLAEALVPADSVDAVLVHCAEVAVGGVGADVVMAFVGVETAVVAAHREAHVAEAHEGAGRVHAVRVGPALDDGVLALVLVNAPPEAIRPETVGAIYCWRVWVGLVDCRRLVSHP